MALGCIKLVAWVMGISEKQFYAQYPFGWYVVVALAFGFMAGLFYTVKKTMDIDPSIQLRSKSDDEIRGILDDSGFVPWHATAERILLERAEKRG